MLTKFVSIGSYSPEVRTFGTLITSTKVFSLIICKTLCQNDPLPRDFIDSVPRDLTILYLDNVDSIHKLGMCSFQHKWASERQLYLFVLLHHVVMK